MGFGLLFYILLGCRYNSLFEAGLLHIGTPCHLAVDASAVTRQILNCRSALFPSWQLALSTPNIKVPAIGILGEHQKLVEGLRA